MSFLLNIFITLPPCLKYPNLHFILLFSQITQQAADWFHGGRKMGRKEREKEQLIRTLNNHLNNIHETLQVLHL